MTEMIPGFGPVQEADNFAADILPEVPKEASPVENIEKIPFSEAIMGRVIESAAGLNPLEQTLDQAQENIVQPKEQTATGYQPVQSVGQILGQQPAINPNLPQTSQPVSTSEFKVSQAVSSKPLSYHRATRLGFVTALITAALVGLLLYLS